MQEKKDVDRANTNDVVVQNLEHDQKMKTVTDDDAV